MLTKRGKRLSAVAVLVAALVAIMIPGPVRWRVEVVLLSLAGRIPDIELKQLLAYLMPSSGQWLRPLIETHNPYVAALPHLVAVHSDCSPCGASGGRAPRPGAAVIPSVRRTPMPPGAATPSSSPSPTTNRRP